MRYRLAVLAALVSVSCGGQSASRPTNPSPVGAAPVAVLSIKSDLSPALGVAGYTPLIFDASASTGTGLRYLIDFGDESSAESVVAGHVGMEGERSRVARLTVTDSLGRTSNAEAPYYVLAVRPRGGAPGGWIYVNRGDSISLGTLVVNANTISGEYSERGSTRRDLALTGTLTRERDIALRSEDGSVVLEGTFAWRTASYPANCGSQHCVSLQLAVRGGRADGQVLDFKWSDPY